MNLVISVIVPVYKVPLEYLRVCLDSLVAQTMQECEFIIVSDGAPEAECSICEEYAAKDTRFKFFNREHAGVSAARNFGINQAQGEYITFVDADDWFSENALQILFNIMEENQAEIGIANSQKIWDNGRRQTLFSFYNHTEKTLLKRIVHVGCWSYIFKNSIIQTNHIQFQEELKLSEDRVFIFEYYLYCQKIAFTNEIIYFYRQHSSSVCKLKQTHEHAIQQLKAAKQLHNILVTSQEFSTRAVHHLDRCVARMGMVAYINSGTTKVGINQLKVFFLENISHSKVCFYYCWWRAKISSMIGNLLHF